MIQLIKIITNVAIVRMNKFTSTLIALAALCLCSPSSVYAVDLYVSPSGSDTAAGSQTAPFKTIQKGVNTTKAGDTLHVLPGTYTESITSEADGTAATRIRYVSTQKWGAKIIGRWRNNGDYNDIEGFEITQNSIVTAGDYGTSGLSQYGSHGRIIGNHVHHVTGSGIDSNGWSAGPYAGVDNHIIGNLVHDTGNKHLVHGIYFSHPQGSIKNNIIYNSPDYCIHLWHNPRDLEISNNLAFNCKVGGLVVGAGDSPGTGLVQNVTVTNNIFMNSSSGFIENGTVGPNNRYINNLIWGNARDSSLMLGTQTGTIKADPMLVNLQGLDFHLQPGSPAIDKGTTTAAPDTDFDGNERPAGAGIDIGPYESGLR
jgi:hypothetical protein